MKILHYFLGFPPFRTGGLTKFAFDLMSEQAENGNIVLALWPGKMKFVSDNIEIKKRKPVNGIQNYELINPLPISLDEGIKNVREYIRSCDEEVFVSFLNKTNPDVIHIHTLMGLYREFVEVANTLNIRCVYTTHDYFGICPKVTLYKSGNVCDEDRECTECYGCNMRALSLTKIRVMQSPLYRILKNSPIVQEIRKRHRTNFFEVEQTQEIVADKDSGKIYLELREYYLDILKKVDLIHFNSNLTEKIYNRYFCPNESKVISITHKDIKDNRKINEWKYNETLRITYLATVKPFKGFEVLKSALDDLWISGYHKFELNVFGQVKNISPYMKVEPNGYTYKELTAIFAKTDVLIAPSIWYETFGFTVLEALSYGVPVIVSDHVGAKDIIGTGGEIVEAGNKEQIKTSIMELTREKQEKFRSEIRNNVTIKTWEVFVGEMYKLY